MAPGDPGVDMQLIVAEKPSVARDLARVLGVRAAGRGAFEGGDWVITWCVGHLVELDEPAAYDPRWKAWRMDTLPMLPAEFRLRPVASGRDQLQVVRGLMRERRFAGVVNACDAGREGELIFRYVYELTGCRLPVRRLWISSMTDEAIRSGFARLRPGVELDRLADAARCRSEADWLVGLNATRAVTVRHRTGGDSPLYSIGRVQTPTLALIVARDRAIRDFVPQDYWEVKGTFTPPGEAAATSFEAQFRFQRRARLGSSGLADALLDRLRPRAGAGHPDGPVVERVQQKKVLEPPPLLFDLTSLQRTANRRFGLSAARTLEIAQALYETHKVLTYPRTDSRYLSKDLAPTLPRLFRAVGALPDYAPFVRPLLAAAEGEGPGRPATGGAGGGDRPGAAALQRLQAPSNRRVFDDAKVEDHHAIIPTGSAIRLEALDRDQRRIFDLVVRRFLGAFHPDAVFASTEVMVRVGAVASGPGDGAGAEAAGAGGPGASGGGAGGPPPAEDEAMIEELPPAPDRFFARGRVRLEAGWQEVAGLAPDADRDGGPTLPVLSEGQRLDGRFAAVAKQTRPPPRHSEASLLAAMETAGRSIDDEALRAAMKDTGLGTPATRAATIETLIKRAFIARAGKNLEATPTGFALIEALPVQSLASPELTGSWEARLARIARGADTRTAFMADIARYVTEVVAAVRNAPVNPTMSGTGGPSGAPAIARTGSDRPGARGSSTPSRSRPGPAAAPPRPQGFGATAEARDGDRRGGATNRRVKPGSSKARRAPQSADGPSREPHAARPAGGSSREPRAARSGEGSTGVGHAARSGEGSTGVGRAARSGEGSTGVGRAARSGETSSSSDRRPTVGRRGRGADAVAGKPALTCPRCRLGQVVAGKRGWGCSRWREGCTFVVWFEIAGKRLSDAQLRELIEKGKTRRSVWPQGAGAVSGRLVLDLQADRDSGAARFERFDLL